MYIAIDVGATNTRVVGFKDLNLTSEVKSLRFKTDPDFNTGFTNIVNAIKEVVGEDKITEIGISHVGDISADKKTVVEPANLPTYNNKPVVKLFEDEFNVPVTLENDSICAGLSEFAFGNFKDTNRLAYMTVSTGIGAVFIKKINESIQVSMADVGHTMIIGEKRLCNCGQVDCIETYVGGKGLSNQHLKDASSIDDLLIWEEAVDYLAIASANLITMYKPKVLVLGGGMIENNEYVRQKLLNEVKQQYRGLYFPQISISEFGDKVGVYGALALLKLKPGNLI